MELENKIREFILHKRTKTLLSTGCFQEQKNGISADFTLALVSLNAGGLTCCREVDKSSYLQYIE